MNTALGRLGRFRPDRRILLWGAVVLNTELLVVLGYLAVVRPAFADTSPAQLLTLYAVPFIWINVALWGVIRTTPSPAPFHRRVAGFTLAAGYFLVLAYAGGLVGPGTGGTGVRVALTSLPPGWSPALLYGGETVSLAILPFKLVGYLALAYLVYATVLEAVRTVAGGLIGLLSCVSCALPVVAAMLSGFVGGSTALLSAAYAQSYALSTVAFVATVVLLTWRPSWETVAVLKDR